MQRQDSPLRTISSGDIARRSSSFTMQDIGSSGVNQKQHCLAFILSGGRSKKQKAILPGNGNEPQCPSTVPVSAQELQLLDLHSTIRHRNWGKLQSYLDFVASSGIDEQTASKRTLTSGNRRRRDEKVNAKGREFTSSLLACSPSSSRTPLHQALNDPETPAYILLQMLRLEPQAISMKDAKGRLPLHVGVANGHRLDVIAELLEKFPIALALADSKKRTPLDYAFDHVSIGLDGLPAACWAPTREGSSQAAWQEAQRRRWDTTHFLLRRSHFLGSGKSDSPTKTAYVDYLMKGLTNAGPPATIGDLLTSSASLLVTMFKTNNARLKRLLNSALFLCVAHQYPLSILMNMVNLFPSNDIKQSVGGSLVATHFYAHLRNLNIPPRENELEDDNVGNYFLDCYEFCLGEGQLPEEEYVFMDWWHKLVYLLFFCANYNINQETEDHLLHAALANDDTPPALVHLLLALHPSSLSRAEPKTGALLLHLVCMQPEYDLKKYDHHFPETNYRTAVVDMILACDRGALQYIYDNRLPLHHAIAAGKTWSSIGKLVSQFEKSFFLVDPKTHLLPFQQAAACGVAKRTSKNEPVHNQEDAGRVLQGDLIRLETVYALLRKCPASINREVTWQLQSQFIRGASGVEMIAAHFLSWCYEKQNGLWVVNTPNLMELRMLMAGTDSLLNESIRLSPNFQHWWQQLTFWIWNKFDDGYGRFSQQSKDNRFLLHAAVSKPDTPPEVVLLILRLFPNSVSVPIERSGTLPLHIACKTPPYERRPLEMSGNATTTIELLLNAFPGAARAKAAGRLPLHIAIDSGKSWNELAVLVDENPGALACQDPHTRLLPFANAMLRLQHEEASRRLRFIARISTPAVLRKREVIEEIRENAKTSGISALSLTYQLVRRSVRFVNWERTALYGSDELQVCEMKDSSEKENAGRVCEMAKLSAKGNILGDDHIASPDTAMVKHNLNQSDEVSKTLINGPLLAHGHNMGVHRKRTLSNHGSILDVLENQDIGADCVIPVFSKAKQAAKSDNPEDVAAISRGSVHNLIRTGWFLVAHKEMET